MWVVVEFVGGTIFRRVWVLFVIKGMSGELLYLHAYS